MNYSEKTRLTTYERTIKSNRDGNRSTIFNVARDESLKNKDVIRDKNQVVFPFKNGSSYKGEWQNDKKHGFGTEHFQNGQIYSGEYKNDKRHGRGTLWVKKGKQSIYRYVGDWAYGEKEGYGVYYYENGDEYKGDWMNGNRHGTGRLDFKNGDYYVGEWQFDKQHGFGSMHYHNGNLFEGLHMNGNKEGKGRYFYASTRKVYEGEWVEDQPICGEFRSSTEDEERKFGPVSIRREEMQLPQLGLQDSENVLKLSVAEIRSQNAIKRGLTDSIFDLKKLDDAKRVFDLFDISRVGSISIHLTEKVFEALGIEMTKDKVLSIIRQLELEDQPLISFPTIIDVAICVYGNE